jgi:hypothetical protein
LQQQLNLWKIGCCWKSSVFLKSKQKFAF